MLNIKLRGGEWSFSLLYMRIFLHMTYDPNSTISTQYYDATTNIMKYNHFDIIEWGKLQIAH